MCFSFSQSSRLWLISVYSRAVEPLPYSLEDRGAGTEDRQLAGEGRTGEIAVRQQKSEIETKIPTTTTTISHWAPLTPQSSLQTEISLV